MRFGPYEVVTVVDADFALDGGSMFGVVPKALWQRQVAADEHNRIALVSRLLLLRSSERTILVDTGLGQQWTDKERAIYAIRSRGGGVVAQLARLDVAPADVTDVVLTHLHFDHAAGTLAGPDAGNGLVFPNARHFVQREQWQWAHAPTEKDAASFRAQDFSALDDADQLVLLDGESEIAENVRVVPLRGHTEAMQAVVVESEDGNLFFGADLLPTTAHLRFPFIMGYDNRPLETLREKKDWLPRLAQTGALVIFEHDPACAAAYLIADKRGVALGERVDLDVAVTPG